MKARIILGPVVVFVAMVSSGFAQEFTFTTTAANTMSSKSTIDKPGLAGNPLAIIVATPVGDTARLNPHAIGAWYYNGKWNIFNTDHAVMPLGLKYMLQVFAKPGANQFLHVVTKYTVADEGSWVDEPALNNNPNAQVKILQNHAPDNRPYFLNKFEATTFYNASSGKWFIKNVNDSPLTINTAYNVVVTSGGSPSIPGPASTASPAIPPITTQAAPTSSAKDPITTTLMTPAPLAQEPSAIKLTFDNLNDFAEKGLPAPAALPFGNVDHAAAVMAQQILKADDASLPVLLTALQAAGFTVIDETGKVLLKPANGKGQGLGFYDFEAVGSLKLDRRGVTTSLEKIAITITKETPQIPARQFAELMLQDLRAQANNSDNAYLRFWARLIIELGNTPAKEVDLMDAPPSRIKFSVLQATLMMRRLQGTLFTLRARATGFNPSVRPQQNYLASTRSQRDEPFYFRPISFSRPDPGPCPLTGDEALILDAAGIGLTTWNGWQTGQLNSPTINQISRGFAVANIVLAWGKLVASVTMMKGEIIVQKPLPLIRTMNSTPGDKRLMVARIWNEVGKIEMLNCVRPILNTATGLDFNLPTDGPLGDAFIEWQFYGENETNLASKKFVFFEAPPGADPKPNKQITDGLGLSKMYLIGYPKVPAVVYQKNATKVEKKAKVLVAVTLKSAKDFTQNFIDLAGTIIGVATGGPLGLIGSAAEIGYRLPYVAARATIPVSDHEECDGDWQGTVTYTVINASKTKTIIKPYISGFQESGGGYDSTDYTVTQSGTVIVNGENGKNSMANASADEIMISDHYTSGKVLCSIIEGPRPFTVRSTKTSYGSGASQGLVDLSISLDKDTYKISLKPLSVTGTVTSNSTGASPGNCAGHKGSSYSSTTKNTWGMNDYIVGNASYGEDRAVLSGSSTSNPVPTVKVTITWNLRRCGK